MAPFKMVLILLQITNQSIGREMCEQTKIANSFMLVLMHFSPIKCVCWKRHCPVDSSSLFHHHLVCVCVCEKSLIQKTVPSQSLCMELNYTCKQSTLHRLAHTKGYPCVYSMFIVSLAVSGMKLALVGRCALGCYNGSNQGHPKSEIILGEFLCISEPIREWPCCLNWIGLNPYINCTHFMG